MAATTREFLKKKETDLGYIFLNISNYMLMAS